LHHLSIPLICHQTITELEDAVGALRQLHSKKRVPSSSKLKSEKEKEKPKDVSKEGMFGIFKKSMVLSSTYSQSWHSDLVYIEDHSSGHSPAEAAFPVDEQSSPPNTGTPADPYHHVQSVIARLKKQHAAITSLMPFAENNPSTAQPSPLPSTVEEHSEPSNSPAAHFTSPINRRTGMSTVTSLSDSGSIWFDADEFDGPEEFFLDSPPLEAGVDDCQIASIDGQSNSHDCEGASDTDEEQNGRPSLAISEPQVTVGAQQVTHRTSLPSGPVADEGSLFAVFKKNVGKVVSVH
jgi:hypothetical protein